VRTAPPSKEIHDVDNDVFFMFHFFFPKSLRGCRQVFMNCFTSHTLRELQSNILSKRKDWLRFRKPAFDPTRDHGVAGGRGAFCHLVFTWNRAS